MDDLIPSPQKYLDEKKNDVIWLFYVFIWVGWIVYGWEFGIETYEI